MSPHEHEHHCHGLHIRARTSRAPPGWRIGLLTSNQAMTKSVDAKFNPGLISQVKINDLLFLLCSETFDDSVSIFAGV